VGFYLLSRFLCGGFACGESAVTVLLSKFIPVLFLFLWRVLSDECIAVIYLEVLLFALAVYNIF
jgi:hypothetical protein